MTNIPINFESASSTASSKDGAAPGQTVEQPLESNGTAETQAPPTSAPPAAAAPPPVNDWFMPIPAAPEPVAEAAPAPTTKPLMEQGPSEPMQTQELTATPGAINTGDLNRSGEQPTTVTAPLAGEPPPVAAAPLVAAPEPARVSGPLPPVAPAAQAAPPRVSGPLPPVAPAAQAAPPRVSGPLPPVAPATPPVEEKRLEPVEAKPVEKAASTSGGLSLDETVQLLSDLATLQENLMRAEEQTQKAHRHVEIVKEQLAKVSDEKNSWQEQLLRQRAEFDNFRKRVEREKQEIRQSVRVEVIAPMLEVLDNLERALNLGQSDSGNLESFLAGVELIQKQMFSALTNFGLTPVTSVGQKFDPAIHEAVATQETEDYKPNTVLDELKRGYMLGERLLRPAMVRVAVRPAQSESEE